LTINTKQLIVRDGAVVATATTGTGQGGNVTVTADSVELTGTSSKDLIPSGLFSDTAGTKNAGDLTINTKRLIVRDGAAVSVSTFGQGQGGNLSVNADESIKLSGTAPNGFASGLYAQSFAAGNAGNITITTGQLSVQNSGTVTAAAGNATDTRVTSVPLLLQKIGVQLPPPSAATGQAGNIKVTAGNVFLDNGKLTAATDSNEGCNITLQVPDLLLMRHGSKISATAGNKQQPGDGGNITIHTPFIVAVPKEDSDISADAYTGKGGNIRITTQGIFGIQFRPQDTPLSDITASSQFGVQGIVTINTPDVDPSRGLTNLPTNLVDASSQIAQTCQTGTAGANQQSSFVITGRGGLPPNPKEALSKDAVFVDWVTLNAERENRSSPSVPTKTTSATPAPLVEAQGWVINAKGEVVLTATASTVMPYSPWLPPVTCRH